MPHHCKCRAEHSARKSPYGAGQEPDAAVLQRGDFITYFRKDDLACTRRLGKIATVYLSEETGEMVGCKIKSVNALLAILGDFKILVHDKENGISLGMLIFAAMSEADSPEVKQEYRRLAKDFGDASIDRESLPTHMAA